jgi:ribonuclease HI
LTTNTTLTACEGLHDACRIMLHVNSEHDAACKKWLVYTDGGCRDNPGPGAWAFVVLTPEGAVLHEGKGYMSHTTNNFAEYMGLLEACRYLNSVAPPETVSFYSDSKLMVEQMLGHWRVNETLLPIYGRAAAEYIDLTERVFTSITHVKRAENKLADALCNQVQDEYGIVCSKKGSKREPK